MFTRQKTKCQDGDVDPEELLPLHQAVEDWNENLVDTLLSSGSLPDAQNSLGETPTHYAILMGRINILKKLVSACKVRGQSWILDIPDIKDRTAVYLAIWKGQVEILQILLEGGAKPDGPLTRLHTCITVCHHGQNHPYKRPCLEQVSPLMMAANVGFVQGLEQLIMYGAKINRSNRHAKTALYYACKNGHNECIKILLQAKAKPHLPNLKTKRDIEQPLIMATKQGNVTAMGFLLKHGAPPSSALMLAAEKKAYNCKECIELLLEYKADINVINDKGENAAMVAAREDNPEALRYG